MFPNPSGMSLLEQKRLQWAREREEMTGLCGLWGALDKGNKEKPSVLDRSVPRRNSLLPPIQVKAEEHPKEEESETSGYLSDSPQHEYESSIDCQSVPWSGKTDNYWGERKIQKNLRNERRLRGTPDSVLSTPEDRLKWGDRGVGVGHLWEPVAELPDSRLPQVIEAYRATPKWLERGLKHSDGNNADILVIHHDDDERPASNFLLGQNVPLPPEVLEEREKKRSKALDHQNAIRRQLEERDRKRKEEKENRIRDERLEEERIRKERESERLRQEGEQKKAREKEMVEKRKEEAMKEALEQAEQKAKDVKKKQRQDRTDDECEKSDEIKEIVEMPIRYTPVISDVEKEVATKEKCVKDSFCQSEIEKPEMNRSVTDSGSQSDNIQSLQFLNEGLTLVLDGGATGNILMPQEAVQLLLMSPSMPVQRPERVLTPSKLRCSRLLMDATTQTDREKCCYAPLSSVRSRRSTRASGRTSIRSDSSDKSVSLERLNSHSQCRNAYKHRSRSQPRLNLGERPKWGINRPVVQYMKQSEKDPHYMRRMKRRARRTKETGTSTGHVEEKLLDSEFRLLAFQTDEEIEEFNRHRKERVLENGFRMDSNPSSPRFIRINDSSNEIHNKEELDGKNGKFSNRVEADDGRKSVSFESLAICPDSNILTGVQLSGHLLENNRHDFEICVTEPEDQSEVLSTCLNPGNDSFSDKPELSYPCEELDFGTLLKDLSSEPSSSRSVSNGMDGDDDDDDDDDDEDNKSVVTGPVFSVNKIEALGHIAALRLGLERLKQEVDSRCSTPHSPAGETA